MVLYQERHTWNESNLISFRFSLFSCFLFWFFYGILSIWSDCLCTVNNMISNVLSTNVFFFCFQWSIDYYCETTFHSEKLLLSARRNDFLRNKFVSYSDRWYKSNVLFQKKKISKKWWKKISRKHTFKSLKSRNMDE